MEPKKHPLKNWLNSVKTWVALHRTRTYLLVGGLLVVITGTTAAIILAQAPDPLPKIEFIKPKPKPIYYAPLTGVVVPKESDVTRPVTAIMLENSPDARPQSGLKAAEIVYEAVAEGGITRFLALYQQEKPSLVGPVRSLRMYYLDWATPYNASIAHIGGSYNALKVVRSGSYRDIDQFFNPDTYWRATDRYAPHNVYTNFSRINALNKAKKYTSSKPKVFERAEPTAKLKQNARTVNLGISGPLYNSSYRYSPKTKLYARSQAGAPHIDREKGQITARVVIALRVNMRQVFEDGYRESITTTGSGVAYVFQNGNVSKVKWQKASRKSQIVFTKNGETFKLAPGKTWISAIPNDGGSVTWK